MRSLGLWKLLMLVALAYGADDVAPLAQEPGPATPEPATREAAIEQAQAEKVRTLHPYVLGKGEQAAGQSRGHSRQRACTWHPFFESAYAGGGFTLGAGYLQHVGPYNMLDVRGSYTLSGYKRVEAEFIAPRLFRRRGALSLLGGWREATQVGFYGIGHGHVEGPIARTTGSSSRTRRRTLHAPADAPASGAARRPRVVAVGAAARRRARSRRSRRVYTPETLPGLGADVTYLHSQGTVGFDWRPSPGYARRGGFYGVTVHDYTDTGRARSASSRSTTRRSSTSRSCARPGCSRSAACVETTYDKDDQQIPFFMLPSLGGGSTLRGFSSWRFRDRNSLLLQAEWRIMVNRFFDTAVFYDAGKVAARTVAISISTA